MSEHTVTLTAKHPRGRTLTGVLFDEADFFDAKRVETIDPRIAAWWARAGTTAELLGIRLEILRERMERDLCPALHRLAGFVASPPTVKLNRHQRRAAAARQRLSARDDLRRLRRSLGRLSVRSQTTPLLLPPGEWHVYYPKA